MTPISDCWSVLNASGVLAAMASGGGRHGFMEALLEPMALVGWIGQAMFFSRFLVQWVVSEKERRSHIPVPFWYLSIAGGILLLIYALWRREPVFAAGQSVGLIVYIRNLMLIHRAKATASASGNA